MEFCCNNMEDIQFEIPPFDSNKIDVMLSTTKFNTSRNVWIFLHRMYLETQILGGFIMELVRGIIIRCKINDVSKIVSADSNIRRSHALFLDSEVLVHNYVKGY